MKRKLAIILIAAIFSSYIPTPVYADATDDQIAKIEKQIEILQAQLEKLKRKKCEQVETESETEQAEDVVIGVAESVSGKTFKITPIRAYCPESVEYFMKDTYPEAGKKFVIIDFEVENISDEDDYFNWYNIDSYVDGYSADIKYEIVSGNLLTGDVNKGKKLAGSLGYEVPIDWKEIEVNYDEGSIIQKSKITATITPDSPIFQ